MPVTSPDELKNRFQYHAPDADKVKQHQAVRGAIAIAADMLNNNLPRCRESSLAMTHLEDAMMWANAAIARHDAKGHRVGMPAGPTPSAATTEQHTAAVPRGATVSAHPEHLPKQ